MHGQPRHRDALMPRSIRRYRDVDLRSPPKARDAVQLQRGVQNNEGAWTKADDRSANPRPSSRRITQLRGRHEASAQKPLPPAGPAELSDLIPGQAGAQRLSQGDHPVLPGRDVTKKLVCSHTNTLPTHPIPPKPLWTTHGALWITPPFAPVIKSFASDPGRILTQTS
ncbi:hypothetical protein O3438_21755 [Micromonospora sp. WMMC250]|nr:hypothetical protein [Micromonospora sp. WMMC250]MCZ7377534.1 hypothetical protein [Micromonospora sp. WMMC250]